jgi:two-component system invasion response regulator UvrY
MNIPIGLVDDHHLVRSGLKMLVNSFKKYKVVLEAGNGEELLQKLTTCQPLPEVLLCDISMQPMNGVETTAALAKIYPSIKVIALTVHNDNQHINNMIEAGARAYLLKESQPDIVEHTISQVLMHGSYYTQEIVSQMIQAKQHAAENDKVYSKKYSLQIIETLTTRELEFVKLSCSELTYKGIADEMNVSHHTINGYRENVFDKLGINSRVGLVLFAIHNGLYQP